MNNFLLTTSGSVVCKSSWKKCQSHSGSVAWELVPPNTEEVAAGILHPVTIF